MQKILNIIQLRRVPWIQLSMTYCTGIKRSLLYENCFNILDLPISASQDDVRDSYLRLVKRFHPDSGGPDANVTMFQKVDEAFKILQAKFAKERRGIIENEYVEAKEFDIKHTAPQHRQYLSNDGFGYGTPFQRQSQYHKMKAAKAQNAVFEYRTQKAQASEGALIDKSNSYYKDHKIKTKYGFDRVVEDLIQEAISKGDFNNLPGTGKPLSGYQSENPYVDFTQHKLNKILIDNGFSPEWIRLQKEIRMERECLEKDLYGERNTLGPYPLNYADEQKWENVLKKYDEREQELNKKIDKYNMVVPILTKQMWRIRLRKMSETILKSAVVPDPEKKPVKVKSNTADNVKGFSSLLASFFS